MGYNVRFYHNGKPKTPVSNYFGRMKPFHYIHWTWIFDFQCKILGHYPLPSPYGETQGACPLHPIARR
ncbi:hypothetical protein AAC03nite_35880 [Alicyclobacillus acidoterrestris]|nr:hypothetical protein AAC03nite_35880 [Alicyclobacillus acidoterrestris]